MFGLCHLPAPKVFFEFSGIFEGGGVGFFEIPVVNLFNNGFWKCTCDKCFWKSLKWNELNRMRKVWNFSINVVLAA